MQTRLTVARGLLAMLACLLANGCGYTTRTGLAPHPAATVYVKPFTNKIDITRPVTGGYDRFPVYRHRMEVDLTNAVIDRFQFTGVLRPDSPARAHYRLEGELVGFRRDALRYNAAQEVEEWRLNVVASLRLFDQTTQMLLWEEPRLIGDTTYFARASGPNPAEPATLALDRAIVDLARRVVERTVEDW